MTDRCVLCKTADCEDGCVCPCHPHQASWQRGWDAAVAVLTKHGHWGALKVLELAQQRDDPADVCQEDTPGLRKMRGTWTVGMADDMRNMNQPDDAGDTNTGSV